jgi:hypothetical protein
MYLNKHDKLTYDVMHLVLGDGEERQPRSENQVGDLRSLKPGLVSYFIIANSEILEVPGRSSRSGVSLAKSWGTFCGL